MPFRLFRVRPWCPALLLSLILPVFASATTPDEENDLFDLIAARAALIPKREIGALDFLERHPTAEVVM